MSFIDNDTHLVNAVNGRSLWGVKAALDAGADVNGIPERTCPPIVAAILVDHADTVELLLDRGADPNRPVTTKIPCPSGDMIIAVPGARALHLAARIGQVGIVRLLLQSNRADPNATDSKGRTPLMGICENPFVCLESVRLLLEAGADPALTRNGGLVPLHGVALKGHVNLVDMLCSKAPASLNHCTDHGRTPLYIACGNGDESMVSKLLSVGAMQPGPLDDDTCPLAVAVAQGFVGVVRTLINEGGIRAVGGELPLSRALERAVQARPVKMLQLLLAAYGEERRSEWANISPRGESLLHHGAAFCSPAVVRVLLEAGADEAALDARGRSPRDAIGLGPVVNGEIRFNLGHQVAVSRMLQRGPAYRARSWAWPSDEEEDAGGSGDGSTAATSTVAVLSSPPGVKMTPVIGVRIFRPKEMSSNKLFARLVSRYCAKD